MKRAFALLVLLSLQAPVLAQMAVTPDGMIQVKKTMTVLDTHLRSKYSAYKVEITSNYPSPLKLDSASIENGVVGQSAALRTKTSWVNIFWGLPGWLLGMGIAALIISHKNGNAETEASEYSNQIPTNTLSRGGSITFKALVPLGQQPEIKLHFVDPANAKSFEKVAALY